MPPQKKLKFKSYKIPAGRHYVLIREPWPYNASMSTARSPQNYVNAVTTWICCMVGDLCDTNINPSDVRIFSQSTHRDLIVEIESETLNINHLLGAHHASDFLIEPGHANNCTSVLYEYDYARFNSPDKTNWRSDVPSNLLRPTPVKCEDMGSSYPTPSPTDAMRHKWAKHLPGRLTLGHPDCIQQTPTSATDPPPPANQPAGPSAPREPSQQPSVAAIQKREASLSPPTRSPPPPEEVPPSQFVFTPYERPLHFPSGPTAVRSPSPPVPVPTRTKRDPYEEEEDALQHLRDTQIAAVGQGEGAIRIKSEIKTEEYEPSVKLEDAYDEMQAARLRDTQTPVSHGDGVLHVKSEIKTEYQPSVKMEAIHEDVRAMRVKQEEGTVKAEYVPGPELQDLFAQATRERERQAVKHEEHEVPIEPESIPQGVKPEPVDVPMPNPRPSNKRFDPFDGYEPEYGRRGVKKEEGGELNSRQWSSGTSSNYPSSSAYPRPPPPRVKQEEFSGRSPPSRTNHTPNVKQEEYGYDSRRYSHGVKQEYNDGGYRSREPPPPSAFSGGYSDYAQRRYSSGSGGRDGRHSTPGAREASRTFSPSPHPVKRERDVYDDRPPPIKRERTESGGSRYVNPPSREIRDPRVRARIER
ncbi:hypothetical protein K438DRAFT_994200 [Mycena galopus ATCC 62051]|nr:hypothetical protein K438DRAFT_994200 [Mycena galopus ATCC 62051]